MRPSITATTLLLAANSGPGALAMLTGSSKNGPPAQQPLGLDLGGKGSVTPKKPNIVFILTDDQDLHMNSLDYLPLIKKHLIDRGTFYKRHFCTTAICCPARVSLWTGKLAHNTNVTDVNPPYGGYPKFLSQGLNENYLPVWLQEAGYNTYYTGKLFNAHTVDNYGSPFPKGWTHSDFLLDPYTYDYLNSSYQRDRHPPVSYEGEHTTDVLASKAFGFLEDAAKGAKGEGRDGLGGPRPFFLGIAPVAPHSNVQLTAGTIPDDPGDIEGRVKFTPPVPAERHRHLFPDARVPRTPNFNPEAASGASWIRRQARLGAENVAANDHFYRQRLRALQSVDELVDGLFRWLGRHGLLEDTYVFYTTDNGFHIGQHRLQPGKECGFEEDVNVPLIVRGPGVPPGRVEDRLVTSHADIAPTILGLAGGGGGLPADDFDGEAIPLSEAGLGGATTGSSTTGAGRREHVAVEFWGLAASEGDFLFDDGERKARVLLNNTYKAARVIGDGYNFYYSVWCSGEHELYDLNTDPYQLRNLLHDDEKHRIHTTSVLGVALPKLAARLDSLLFVLKSCRGRTCVRPWEALHPLGDVVGLRGALSPRFDDFYEALHPLGDVVGLRGALSPRFDDFYEVQQARVGFDRCEQGYIVESEGPQFERDGVVYTRQGAAWHEWV